MGLREGHVTSPEIGLSRPEQCHVIGNGVVPMQAAAAFAHLMSLTESWCELIWEGPDGRVVWDLPDGDRRWYGMSGLEVRQTIALMDRRDVSDVWLMSVRHH